MQRSTKNLLIFISLMAAIIISVTLIIRKINAMDYTVKLSTLPEEQLWAIVDVEQMLAETVNRHSIS